MDDKQRSVDGVLANLESIVTEAIRLAGMICRDGHDLSGHERRSMINADGKLDSARNMIREVIDERAHREKGGT